MHTDTHLIRNCIYCDKPIKGRTDKKFCNDYCRNSYNNQLKATTSNLVRNINNALSKNRRILEKMIPPGEEMAKVGREKMQQLGYQFRFMTHVYTNKKGSVYYYCYEYGYLLLENECCLIVKAKPNDL
jgi:hypothetical protein